MKHALTLALVTALAACGSDGDSGICSAVGGGASSVTTSPAVSASFSDADNAFDGALGSFATLSTAGGTGASSIRGTMQSGTAQPAGTYPGVYFSGSISSNLKVTVTTYLQGTQQETGAALSTVTRGSDMFYGRQVSAPYDAIEVEFNLAGDDSEIEIFELCVGDKNFE